MTPASIMMGVSRIETSWAPPPAIVGESGAEEKAKFFFPSIDDSQSEKKKKECPRVSRGKERRTKQKQKQASKQEKKTPLSLSFSFLTVEKKSRRSKQKKNAAQRLSIHPLRISPRAFQQKCASPSCSSLSAWRFSRPWYGRWKRLWASVVPMPAASSLSSPSKKNIRVCIPLRSRWSTFSRPFPHGTSRALLFVLPFGRKRPEKEHARALWPADHSSETVYRSRIVL